MNYFESDPLIWNYWSKPKKAIKSLQRAKTSKHQQLHKDLKDKGWQTWLFPADVERTDSADYVFEKKGLERDS